MGQNLQRVLLTIYCSIAPHRLRESLPQIEKFLLPDQDLMAMLIDSKARLNHKIAIPTRWLRMLPDTQAGDAARAMQGVLVAQLFLNHIRLLVGKIALDQQLACEVIVARHLGCAASPCTIVQPFLFSRNASLQ